MHGRRPLATLLRRSRWRAVAGDSVQTLGDQFLDQLRARGLVLDQHDRRGRSARIARAMFNPVVVSKLRGCDRISLKLDDVCAEARVPDRATVIQK